MAGLAATGEPAARILGSKPPQDPYPLYERIRALGELVPSRMGVYLTASRALSYEVLRDARFGVVPGSASSVTDWNVRPGDADFLVHPVEHSLLMMDPPVHTALRRLISPWFTPRALQAFRPDVERIVSATLDGLDDRAEFDLVAEFAVPVVLKVICRLLDLPETGLDRFGRWGATLARSIGGIRSMKERRQVRATLAEMTAFFEDVVAARRASPGEDLISELLRAEVDGEALARRDLLGLVGLMLGAGFETTVNSIGNGTLALAANPDVRRALAADLELGPAVVEEVLRYDSPVQYTGRRALETVTLAGTELPPGTIVVTLIGAANRDPLVFGSPQAFDISRANNRDHLAFSGGIHYCLAAGLARIETECALGQLFTRFPDLEVGAMARLPKRNIRGPRTMRVMHSPGRVAVPR
jgi:cytochrome P450